MVYEVPGGSVLRVSFFRNFVAPGGSVPGISVIFSGRGQRGRPGRGQSPVGLLSYFGYGTGSVVDFAYPYNSPHRPLAGNAAPY